jgi:hypothetical protein
MERMATVPWRGEVTNTWEEEEERPKGRSSDANPSAATRADARLVERDIKTVPASRDK